MRVRCIIPEKGEGENPFPIVVKNRRVGELIAVKQVGTASAKVASFRLNLDILGRL